MSNAGPCAPLLSIVIPVRDEESRITGALERVRAWRDAEVLVAVDDRSRDASWERVSAVRGVRVLKAAGAGRGPALASGARAARGEYLLFLHADSRLEESAVRAAIGRLGGDTLAAAFSIRLDSPRPVFRLLEAAINLRSRLFDLPYGDQGLLISRKVFEDAGGLRPLARCEDLDLVLRLRKRGRIALAPGPCVTSTRRWDHEGVLRVTASNLASLVRFLFTLSLREGVHSHAPNAGPSRRDPGTDPSPVDQPAVRG